MLFLKSYHVTGVCTSTMGYWDYSCCPVQSFFFSFPAFIWNDNKGNFLFTCTLKRALAHICLDCCAQSKIGYRHWECPGTLQHHRSCAIVLPSCRYREPSPGFLENQTPEYLFKQCLRSVLYYLSNVSSQARLCRLFRVHT